MDRQQALQSLLETMGAEKVYFQPPENVRMEHPCIVFGRDGSDTKFADNVPYSRTKRYQVTVIDRDPTSPIPDRVADLPMCELQRSFVTDNLNHDVFNIFF